MGGPVFQEQPTTSETQDLSPNTLYLAVTAIRDIIPNLSDAAARAMAQAVHANNKPAFEAAANQAGVGGNLTQLFERCKGVVERIRKDVVPHQKDAEVANADGNTRAAHRERQIAYTALAAMAADGLISGGTAGVLAAEGSRRAIDDVATERDYSDEKKRQMQQDAARSLVQIGVPLSVIMGTFGSGIFGPSLGGADDTAAQFQEDMVEATRERDTELRGELRDLQEKIGNETNDQKREDLERQYQWVLAQYSRQMGGGLASIADAWARGEEQQVQDQRGRTVPVGESEFQRAARAHAEQVIALHTGQLDRVIPGRVAPRQAE